MKNKIDSSRRKTPWDDNKEISVTQKFIKEKYLSNYKIKHSSLSDSMEYELINSVEIKECKYCCSKKLGNEDLLVIKYRDIFVMTVKKHLQQSLIQYLKIIKFKLVNGLSLYWMYFIMVVQV